MPEPARRVEIFTGAGRRRRWSGEEKAAIVAESLGGRESVSSVARRHGLTPAQLFGWRRQAGQGSASVSQRVSFATVVVGAAPIEIALGDATIRVPAGSDATTLRAVLQAVKALA
jgi:transposase